MKFFLSQYISLDFRHGGVGYANSEKILLRSGYQPVVFPHAGDFSLKSKCLRIFSMARWYFKIPESSEVVFIHPVYPKVARLLVWLLKNKKGMKLICFIADIDGFKDGNKNVLRREIRFFKQFSNFIVHNREMRGWLVNKLDKDCNISEIGFFDFLTAPVVRDNPPSFDIAFAGNLRKSTFLDHIHLLQSKNPLIHFHLYGERPDNFMVPDNATWHGVHRPYELTDRLIGSFGLVWDGDSIERPGGYLGEYMKYISPHKISLYILSQLPLIVPQGVAVTFLVEKYNIGIVVKCLNEIQDKINKLSIGEYQVMRANMKPLAEKISSGQCLIRALRELS